MDKDLFYEVVEKAKKYDELIPINRTKELCCSFCGKSQSVVEKIIMGVGVTICNECVQLCGELLNEIKESKQSE